MENNPELQLAWQFIENTGTHLFLTGKAGTGKTTFLRRLKEHTPKRMVILAPTGIAAINAGGVTIHSFFQLSFAPLCPKQPLILPRHIIVIVKKSGISSVVWICWLLMRSVWCVLICWMRWMQLCGGIAIGRNLWWGATVDDWRFATAGACRERQ